MRAMQNPFRYGAKVTGWSFHDRREIKASIINVIDGCNNAVLYGPRRYGKSSLVADSQIDSVDGAYRLIDSLFANHLRRAGTVSPLTAAHNM